MADLSVTDTIRRRRMVRAFTADAVRASVVDELCDLARRAPSAGNTQSIEFLVLEGDLVGAYWDVTLPRERRDRFAFPGLIAAPVLIVPYVHPGAYTDRYSESDKARTGLGAGVDAWPVPYWWVDGGAAVENLLLAATERGLGACFFGQFDHEAAVRERFSVAPGRRALGTIALGWPAADPPGASVARPRPDLTDVVIRPHRL